ncbi:MAG: transcriptional regulator [Ahrensia sp.]|nr:transcriptional regulator [Ahrensia sp.]
MSEEELMANALSDPDAQPLTDEELGRMRQISFAKHLRFKFGLTQEEFATRFRIPIGTLRDWEQYRSEPNEVAKAYLKVIAADPEAAAKALETEEAA